jgi:hypothetical protein
MSGVVISKHDSNHAYYEAVEMTQRGYLQSIRKDWLRKLQYVVLGTYPLIGLIRALLKFILDSFFIRPERKVDVSNYCVVSSIDSYRHEMRMQWNVFTCCRTFTAFG